MNNRSWWKDAIDSMTQGELDILLSRIMRTRREEISLTKGSSNDKISRRKLLEYLRGI